jgi:hypothetical protein
MTPIRALIIDPHKTEVRQVHDDFNNADVLRQYLAQGERGPLRAPLCLGGPIAQNVHMYVDDFGCFREGQRWFRVASYSHATPGYGIILGSGPEGEEVSVPDWVTVPMVYGVLLWPSPEEAQADFPDVVVSTFDPDTGKIEEVSRHPVDFSRREPYGREG